ncbi:hypothetical protein P280DRAFT_476092 [Massarina eburnea CBS 473.64]|uniref:Uncharacterized protein n=1 Tax=Massarina eburnea CBS 473.64 TaxID=1395130 RepID=A0A6A6SFW1_9PLEO|nr:hypothetical protein P280DRAFT_476092 [Massarina eburnea CBS 473.64]
MSNDATEAPRTDQPLLQNKSSKSPAKTSIHNDREKTMDLNTWFPFDDQVAPWLKISELPDLRLPDYPKSPYYTFNSSITREPDRKSVTSADIKLDLSIDPLPPLLRNKDPFPVRVKVLRVRTKLMTCQIIDRTATTLERKRDPQPGKIYQEYSKMLEHANNALQVARELRSDGLQARCHYWIGMATGKLRKWHNAVTEFKYAIELGNVDYKLEKKEVPDESVEEVKKEPTGLRPAEYRDVLVLFMDVSVRAKEKDKRLMEKKAKKDDKTPKIPKKAGKPFKFWNPHRDAVLQQYAYMMKDGLKAEPNTNPASTSGSSEIPTYGSAPQNETISESDRTQEKTPDKPKLSVLVQRLTKDELNYIHNGETQKDISKDDKDC